MVDAAFDTIAGALADVPRTASADERLAIMREVYREITDRRELALVVVQAIGVAVDDPDVRAVIQAHVRALHKTVWAAAGGDTDRVREFFGVMLLLNTVAAIDVPELPRTRLVVIRPAAGRRRAAGACSASVWRRNASMPTAASTAMTRTEKNLSKIGSGPQMIRTSRITAGTPNA